MHSTFTRIPAILFFLMTANISFSQSEGDYQTIGSGSWNTAGIWERYNGTSFIATGTPPSSTDGVITIRNGHTVLLNSAVTADQVVIASGGAISMTSTFTLNNGDGDEITVDGDFNYQSGSLTGAGTVSIGNTGTLAFSTGSVKTTGSGITITNDGTINWTEGGINGSAAIVNNNDFNINANALWQFSGGLTNTGTINKTTGATTIATPWSNSGTINLNGGSITSSNVFTNTGTIAFTNGSTWQNNSTFNHNTGSVVSGTGNFGNSGTLVLNISQVFPSTLVFSNSNNINGSGDLTVNNDLVILGNISGTGAFTLNGNGVWQSGVLGRSLTMAAGRTLDLTTAGVKSLSSGVTLTNNGTMSWEAGGLNFSGAVVNNNIFNISANALWQFSGGLTNTGTINKTAGATTIATPWSNSGTINMSGGSITSSNTFTNTGTIAFTNGSTWQNNSTFNHNTGSVVSGTGNFGNSSTLTLNISQVFPSTLVFSNSNTINGNGDLTVNNDMVIQGNITGSGAFTLNGNGDWQSGNLGRSLTIDAGRTLQLTTGDVKTFSSGNTLTNNGTMSWEEGGLNFPGAVINNNIFNISANALWQFAGGIINNGTLTKTNTGTVNLSTPVTNSATGIIQGTGTISFNSTFSNSGTIAPGLSPGILELNGAQPLSAGSTLSIELNDGTGAGTGHDQLQRSGDLTLAGTLTATETGTVPNGSYTIIALSSGTISGSFATTNLPAGYTLQVNATEVVLVRSLIPTPLNWISFTGEKARQKIVLDWVTENEVNTSHFMVERSSNGVEYTAIGNLAAAGQSRNEYSFDDLQPLKGLNLYRIRQVDQDGAFKYSIIVRVYFGDDAHTLKLFPNPVRKELFIEFAGGKNVLVQIHDAGGRLVSSRKMENQNLLSISVASLPQGSYWMVVSDGVTRQQAVFIKE